MKFYIKQHKHYCGIDLHARSMYLCILDSKSQVKLHKDIKTSPEALIRAIKPYLDDLIIAVECMFSWYWIADFCEDNNIKFILGHALYMKAIHGSKVRNDKVDSHKIASLGVFFKNESHCSNPRLEVIKVIFCLCLLCINVKNNPT